MAWITTSLLPMSESVWKKILRKAYGPANIIVKEYSGYKPEESVMALWRDKDPFKEGRWWRRFNDAAKGWYIKQMRERQAAFVIDLHDSPSTVMSRTPSIIDFRPEYFILNTKMKAYLEEYRGIFQRTFPRHIYRYFGHRWQYFYHHVLVELDHCPVFVDKDDAVNMTRSFSAFLAQKYGQTYRKNP